MLIRLNYIFLGGCGGVCVNFSNDTVYFMDISESSDWGGGGGQEFCVEKRYLIQSFHGEVK